MNKISKEELENIIKNKVDIISFENEEAWHKLRGGGIGGSDIGAILGVNKYRSIVDVFLSKKNKTENIENDSIKWGKILEGVIASEFARNNESLYKVWQVPFTLKYGEMVANLDGLIQDVKTKKYGILEIKTASTFMASEWEENIPQSYYAQVMHYLAVTGLDFGIVAVLIGGNKYKEYYIERNEEEIEYISRVAKDFWQEYVLKNNIPSPDGSDAYSEFQKKELERLEEKGDVLELEDEDENLLEEYIKLSLEAKKLEKRMEEIKQIELNKLIEENYLRAKSSNYSINIIKQNRKVVDKDKFKISCKDLIEEYKKNEEKFKLDKTVYLVKINKLKGDK